MADVILVPGVKTKVAGQYVEIDAAGAIQNDGIEATLAEGDKAPPTDEPNRRWLLVDASKRAGDVPADEKPEPRKSNVLKSSRRIEK